MWLAIGSLLAHETELTGFILQTQNSSGSRNRVQKEVVTPQASKYSYTNLRPLSSLLFHRFLLLAL